jgi:hypothetical protein
MVGSRREPSWGRNTLWSGCGSKPGYSREPRWRRNPPPLWSGCGSKPGCSREPRWRRNPPWSGCSSKPGYSSEPRWEWTRLGGCSSKPGCRSKPRWDRGGCGSSKVLVGSGDWLGMGRRKEWVVASRRCRESAVVDGLEPGGECVASGAVSVGHGVDVCKWASRFTLPIGLEPEAERCWSASGVMGELRPVGEIWF